MDFSFTEVNRETTGNGPRFTLRGLTVDDYPALGGGGVPGGGAVNGDDLGLGRTGMFHRVRECLFDGGVDVEPESAKAFDERAKVVEARVPRIGRLSVGTQGANHAIHFLECSTPDLCDGSECPTGLLSIPFDELIAAPDVEHHDTR